MHLSYVIYNFFFILYSHSHKSVRLVRMFNSCLIAIDECRVAKRQAEEISMCLIRLNIEENEWNAKNHFTILINNINTLSVSNILRIQRTSFRKPSRRVRSLFFYSFTYSCLICRLTYEVKEIKIYWEVEGSSMKWKRHFFRRIDVCIIWFFFSSLMFCDGISFED